jgi:hypothetical protein
VRTVEPEVSRYKIGVGRRDERPPARVGNGRVVSILRRSNDRAPRPPEVEVVLVVPSVDRRVGAAKFSIARRRALSAASRRFRVINWRATSLQLATGLLCHHLAMYDCSSVREELVALPSDLTSLKSASRRRCRV